MERKRLMVIGILSFLLALGLQASCSAQTVTSVNISNGPPILIEIIPDQYWASGYNLTRAFDLDDYFIDPNGDNITYSYSSVENVTVVIDSLNWVSFYPDPSFLGTRNLTFYASDSEFSTSSNLVFLFIGEDTEPPQWHSPGRNKVVVYQSSYVNFTTSWTDNFQLGSYYFSIDQGGGWVNSSAVNFSGTSNVSKSSVQISGAPTSTVYWRFCAEDSSLNPNCTAIQNFTVAQREVPPTQPPSSPQAPVGEEVSVSDYVSRLIREKTMENFTIEPDLFKISLKQGATETRIIKITNIGTSNLSFKLSIFDVENLVFLSEREFTILSGKSKEITVDFTATLATPPSQYFGLIRVDSSETKYVPVILDVNALNLDFSLDVVVPQEYKGVMPGETVWANLSLLNLKDIVEANMTLYTAIKDFYGNIYDSGEERFIFNSSLFFRRNLTVPEFVGEGPYIFYARAYCEQGLALDSDTFEVGSRFMFLSSLRSSFVFVLIFFLCIIALVLMVVYSRSKEKERLLSLYLMLNELKNLIKEDKFDEAVDLYVRIKKFYGERVSRAAIQDREHLKEEIRQLSLKLKEEVKKTEKTEPANIKKAETKKPEDNKKTEKTKPENIKKAETKKPEDNKKTEKTEPAEAGEAEKEKQGENEKGGSVKKNEENRENKPAGGGEK
ncbi:hypothetical protein A3K73_05965 [Candidatus Pacearchaeota archaeon RBG_13_36_9]|nr:MAG: hypothetical protein A3K73_05965 [Candidatus Pacearchaeota archaeon RBG_13_36_9]